MTERARNLAVGLTVMIAIAMLSGMIVIFTGLPDMFRQGYDIHMRFPTTADAHQGDDVHLVGMMIGKITGVRFTDPADPGKGVTFTASIDNDVDIPANVKAYILTKGFVGGAWLELKSDAPVPVDPGTGKPAYLPRNGTAVVEGILKGSGVIPDELLEAISGLSELGRNLNRLIAPPAEPTTAPDGPASRPTTAKSGLTGLHATIDKLNRTLDAMHAILGDAENRANLKTSLANLAKATAQANEAMAALKKFATDATKGVADARKAVKDISLLTSETGSKIDELSAKLIDNAEKISRLMTTMNKAAEKLEAGKGSAGMLLNDPKLYNSLLEATRQLTRLLTDFDELIKTWKAEGVDIRVK